MSRSSCTLIIKKIEINMINMIEIGKKLKQRAAELGLTDAEVARRTKIPHRTYAFYAEGKRRPPYEKLVRICEVLNISPNNILGYTDISNYSVDSALLKQVIKASVTIMSKYEGNPRVTLDWLSNFIAVVYEKYHNEKIKEKTNHIEDNVIYGYFDAQVETALKQAS